LEGVHWGRAPNPDLGDRRALTGSRLQKGVFRPGETEVFFHHPGLGGLWIALFHPVVGGDCR